VRAAVGIGLVGGALLAWATLTLSRTDIGGPGWSLRGNGALIVEFAAGPALLAGGWVFLARQRPGPSLIAAALTLAIELGLGFGPILAGPSAGPQTPLLVGLVAVVLALLVGLGLVWPPRRQDVLLGLAVVLFSMVLSLALPFLIFVLAPLLLPLVIAAPTLGHHARRARIPAAVALPLTLVAATLAAQRLLAPA
jgi:hypothetical protein